MRDEWASLEPYSVVVGGDMGGQHLEPHGLCHRVDSGEGTVIWYVLECMQRAHDRWLQLTGTTPRRSWADYPVELGKATAQFDFGHTYRCINIDPASFDPSDPPWTPTLVYHEFGHWLHYDSYTSENVGPDSNAYAAYNGL